MDKQWKESFESYAEGLLDTYSVPGLAVGVNQNGSPLYFRGFGFRDVEQGLPVTEDTVFGIGSVTKSFTCVAIMQLEEQGKLSVADKVIQYLPEFKTPNPEYTAQMTIHHFMTHTSGLPPLPALYYAMKRSMELDSSLADNEQVQSALAARPPIDTYEELMEYIGSLDFELLGPPGQYFSYSNDAVSLLGAIIERVSGVSYEKYIEENVLRPAGMEHSTFVFGDATKDWKTPTLYEVRKGESGDEVFASPQWWEAPSMLPAGFLKSSVHDMLRYAEIFRTGGLVGTERILSAESVERMTQPHAPCQPGSFYGYGLMVQPDFHGVTLVEHGGDLKGVAAQMCIVKEHGLTAVTLSNLAGVPSSQITLGAINSVLELAPNTPPVSFEDFDVPVSELSQYSGSYVSSEGGQLGVQVQDDQLCIVYDGKTYVARAVGQHVFLVEFRESQLFLSFLMDENGQVSRASFGLRIINKAPALKTELG